MTDKIDRPLELASRANSGDPEARRKVFDACGPVIRRAVFDVLGPGRPEQDHQEVIQHAFMVLFEALSRYRGEACLTAFARAIARRQAQQFLTRANRRPVARIDLYDNSNTVSTLEDPAPDAERQLAGRELCALLFACLEQELTPRELLLYRLHFQDGLDADACRAVLGISRANYDLMLHRIRVKAREIRDRLL